MIKRLNKMCLVFSICLKDEHTVFLEDGHTVLLEDGYIDTVCIIGHAIDIRVTLY